MIRNWYKEEVHIIKDKKFKYVRSPQSIYWEDEGPNLIHEYDLNRKNLLLIESFFDKKNQPKNEYKIFMHSS